MEPVRSLLSQRAIAVFGPLRLTGCELFELLLLSKMNGRPAESGAVFSNVSLSRKEQ